MLKTVFQQRLTANNIMITYVVLNYSCADRRGPFSSICRARVACDSFAITFKEIKCIIQITSSHVVFGSHTISSRLRTGEAQSSTSPSGHLCGDSAPGCYILFFVIFSSTTCCPEVCGSFIITDIHQCSPQNKPQTKSVSVTMISNTELGDSGAAATMFSSANKA